MFFNVFSEAKHKERERERENQDPQCWEENKPSGMEKQGID